MTEVKITDDMKAKLQRDAQIPHLPTDLTYECRMAVSGEGPRAYDWSDKPHRLVYDLCRHIEALSASTGAGHARVRPLAWVEDRFSGQWQRFTAESVLGRYEALEWSDGGFGGSVPGHDEPNVEFTSPSMDEAKAFAQADFEARIRSAILPDGSGAEAVAWRWDQATNEGDWQTAFTEHGEPQPSPTVHNVTPLYSSPSASVEKALDRALDFIESLTADPLLMGLDDVEMTLEDVQSHAGIELDSIRRQLHAEGK